MDLKKNHSDGWITLQWYNAIIHSRCWCVVPTIQVHVLHIYIFKRHFNLIGRRFTVRHRNNNLQIAIFFVINTVVVWQKNTIACRTTKILATQNSINSTVLCTNVTTTETFNIFITWARKKTQSSTNFTEFHDSQNYVASRIFVVAWHFALISKMLVN